ncbi:MAG: amino acid ABC transporter substrate-binding protein [Desulfovibrionales bacterium]
MKKLIGFLAVLCLVLSAVSAMAADDSWNRIEEKGELVIGLDDAFPPMGFRQADGTLVGFDIDAAEEVGRRLGIAIVWQPTAWDGVIHSLNSKKFDAIWNGMTITEERAQKVNFTRPYIMDGQIAVVPFAKNEMKSLEDLQGKVLGVQKGSSALNAVKKLPGKPAEVREYADNPKALLDLSAGRLDAVVVDNVAGRYMISQRPGEFKTLPGFISKEPFGVAFRQGETALLERVQATIDAMVADGTMGQISRKWFGEDITNPAQW